MTTNKVTCFIAKVFHAFVAVNEQTIMITVGRDLKAHSTISNVVKYC